MTRHLYFGGAALIAAAAFIASFAHAGGIPVLDTAVIVAGVTGVAAVLVLGAVSHRLNVLRETAARATAADLTARFDDGASDEIGLLAAELDRLAGAARAASTEASEGMSRLFAVLDSSADPIVAMGREGKITLANAAAQNLLTSGSNGLIGSSLSWVLPQEDVDAALRRAIAAGESSTVALEIAPGNHYQVSITPIVGGGDWLVLAIFRDHTELHRTERMRRDFIANVSHELRTPIASIKAVVETLEAGAVRDEARASEFLGRAGVEVDRLAALVEQLLQLSRLESGATIIKQERLDLGLIAANAVDRLLPVAEQRGIHLIFAGAEGEPVASGDRALVEQALTNIVENALKFTPAEGEVAVTAGRLGDSVFLAVRDSGIGIDAADLSRIFERFYKVDAARGQPGTGLGLAIARHAVESTGGHIEVESTYGSGAIFTLYLPAAD